MDFTDLELLLISISVDKFNTSLDLALTTSIGEDEEIVRAISELKKKIKKEQLTREVQESLKWKQAELPF